jgi:hypothetical protein
MPGLRLLAAIGLCAAVSGCGTDALVCTAVFVAIPATVVNGAGQALSGVSVTDTVRRTGAVLNVTNGSSSPSPGTVIIFSDVFLSAITPLGDDVIVVATAGGHAGNATYRFGSDGCHVRKLAGPDTLVVP